MFDQQPRTVWRLVAGQEVETPFDQVQAGDILIVHAGQIMGTIEVTGGSVTVTSAHTGFLMGLLALPGERVRAEQPLAWVRVVA